MESLSPSSGGDKIVSLPQNSETKLLADAIALPKQKHINTYLKYRYGKQALRVMNKVEKRELYRTSISGANTTEKLASAAMADVSEFDEDYTEPVYAEYCASTDETPASKRATAILVLPDFDGPDEIRPAPTRPIQNIELPPSNH